jgi:peptide/nickel transport system permease protein
MLRLTLHRLLHTLATLVAVSVLTFVLIQLPPGDFADSYINKKYQAGAVMTQDDITQLRHQLGTDRPLHVQYFSWISGVMVGDFGFSWEYRKPVIEAIGERLDLTLMLAISTLIFTYAVALPIGIYSAVRQYSIGDHGFTIIGYIGLATPNFLLALILMYLGHHWFGQSVGGLFSTEYMDAPWSWDRLFDMLAHLWVPVVVLGTAGTAFQIRTMRAVLLDEINKMYVTAARAGGLSEMRVLIKYPVRVALNPIASTLGWELTTIISGAPIVGVVMSLPDTGPLFLQSLLDQDMYLAGAMILIYSVLVVIGTFISDLLLIVLDPRIRLEARS